MAEKKQHIYVKCIEKEKRLHKIRNMLYSGVMLYRYLKNRYFFLLNYPINLCILDFYQYDIMCYSQVINVPPTCQKYCKVIIKVYLELKESLPA